MEAPDLAALGQHLSCLHIQEEGVVEPVLEALDLPMRRPKVQHFSDRVHSPQEEAVGQAARLMSVAVVQLM